MGLAEKTRRPVKRERVDFADSKVPYATCVDRNGKKYNTELDNLTPIEK